MEQAQSNTIILGIDPGTAVCGWGVLTVDGNQVRSLAHGCWRTSPKDSRSDRLAHLVVGFEDIVKRFSPTHVAIEEAFGGRNMQSALRLGEARGALLVAASRAQLHIEEYSPASVKKCVVGNGRADKEQVQYMIQRLLSMAAPPSPLDASDALAIAFTLAMRLPSSYSR